jgi:hypothetical protein
MTRAPVRLVMVENPNSGDAGHKPANATGATGTSAQTRAPSAEQATKAATVARPLLASATESVVRRSTGPAATPGSGSTSALTNTAVPQPTIECPKCGASVREVARFCQRCHNTMRLVCPACNHQQRTGGKCEKCGVNFIKYVGAVVAAKQAQADAVHEKLEQRSTLLKNLLFIPLTGGISLIRQLLAVRNRKS